MVRVRAGREAPTKVLAHMYAFFFLPTPQEGAVINPRDGPSYGSTPRLRSVTKPDDAQSDMRLISHPKHCREAHDRLDRFPRPYLFVTWLMASHCTLSKRK